MPRVEELELEPRNVPERPLKREVKREGVQRRDKGTGLRCVLYSTIFTYVCWRKEEEGVGISSLSVLSTVSIYPRHLHLHPLLLRHFGSDQPQFTRLFSEPSLPAGSQCHILCLVSAVIYGRTQEAVCTYNCTVTVKTEERDIHQTSRGCH